MGTEGEAEGGEEEKEERRTKKRQRGWREGSKKKLRENTRTCIILSQKGRLHVCNK